MIVNSSLSPLRKPGLFLAETWDQIRLSTGLARMLLRARLAQLYRYSSLGLLWAVVPTLVITVGVTLSLHTPTQPTVLLPGEVPLQVHVAFGVVLMQTFVEAFNGQRSIFDLHLSLLQRMKFPLEAVVMAQVAESGFNLLAKLPVLLLVLVFFGVPLKLQLLLGLLACLPVLLAGIALGALVAPISALGKDLDRAMAFVPWLVFLATPVFYRTPDVGPWAWLQALNPLTAMLDVVRYLSYGGGNPHWSTFWMTLVGLMLCLPLGWVVCKLAPPHLAERLSA